MSNLKLKKSSVFLFFILVFTPFQFLKAQFSNGTGSILYHMNGNVGIGIDNPASKLDVHAGETAALSPSVNINGAYLTLGDFGSAKTFSGGLGIKFYDDGISHASLIYSPDVRKFYFGESSSSGKLGIDAGATTMTITTPDGAGGNVGIGTLDPAYKLTVRKDNTSTGIGVTQALVLANNEYTVGTGVSLGFSFSSGDIGASITGKSLQSNGGGSLHFNVRNNYGTDMEAVTISSDGNLGVGISNPTSKLSVSGNITTTSKMFFRNLDGTGTAGFGKSGDGKNIHLEGTALLPHTNNIQNLGSNYYRFNNIYSSGLGSFAGKVVIGASNPGNYKLAVEGQIGARSIKVTSAAWADYVFSPTYLLTDLYEVEGFIKMNGHLPNVPSAKEIEEDGFVLEEMDSKLMEKIEELTLYMIEQQKQLDKQAEEIEKLTQALEESKK